MTNSGSDDVRQARFEECNGTFIVDWSPQFRSVQFRNKPFLHLKENISARPHDIAVGKIHFGRGRQASNKLFGILFFSW